MQAYSLVFLLSCLLLFGSSRAFTATPIATTTAFSSSCALFNPRPNALELSANRNNDDDDDDNDDAEEQQHPAVVGWPEKYVASGGSPDTQHDSRVISFGFDVHGATDFERSDLDVERWPTWTTGDKPKWDVGNRIEDKEMPYGKLSYLIKGKLEITPKSTGSPVLVTPGDLVTFPKGFVASWRILEELTWHYYLY